MSVVAAPAWPTVYPTIGVDPGQRWVGLAVRIDGACVDAVTLGREVLDPGADDRARYRAEQRWAGRVLDEIHALMDRHHQVGADAAARWVVDWQVTPFRVAIEGLNKPDAFLRGRRVPAGHRLHLALQLLEVTVPYAAVIGHFPGAVIVAPADRRPHADTVSGGGYPPELTGFRPRRFGRNEHPRRDRVHERSAWATAGAAQAVRPLRAREVPA